MPPNLINIIDLEATCWKGVPPPGQTNEIIEIGICVLDARTLKPVERRSIVVAPERSEISAFCTELTGWTAEGVAKGVSFGEACAELVRDFAGPERVWVSWGDYDRKQLQRQCTEAAIPYPLSSRHINAKKVFAEAHGMKKQLGMAGALAHAGLPLAGRHHSGVDDALNIATLVATLIACGSWPDAVQARPNGEPR